MNLLQSPYSKALGNKECIFLTFLWGLNEILNIQELTLLTPADYFVSTHPTVDWIPRVFQNCFCALCPWAAKKSHRVVLPQS